MNCKPGDLAYIVRSQYPENVGRIVSVLGPSWIHGCDWAVEPVGAPIKGHKPSNPIIIEKSVLGHCSDSQLRPISGVPVHDEHRDEVTA